MDESRLNVAMERYARGDDDAFAALYAALYPRIRAYLMRLEHSNAVACDLVQETFLHLHRARARFAPGSAVVPWVYAIARNTHVDYLRTVRRRAALQLCVGARLEPSDRGVGDAEQVAIVMEAARDVERVLGGLPAAQREAFVLLRFEGLSVDDAAAVVGTTPTAIKLRAFRAYEALRTELDLGRRKGLQAASENGAGQVRRAGPKEKTQPVGMPAEALPPSSATYDLVGAETPNVDAAVRRDSLAGARDRGPSVRRRIRDELVHAP